MSANALDSRMRGNDELLQTSVISVEAGIQKRSENRVAQTELPNGL
jgi:hypothetical protein